MEDEIIYWPFERPVRAPVYDLDGDRLPSEDFIRFHHMINNYKGDMRKLPGIVQHELELLREKKKLQPESNEDSAKDR